MRTTCAIVVLIMSSVSIAQQQPQQPPPPQASSVDTSGVQGAQAAVTEAQAQMNQIVRQHETTLQATPEWKEADAALAKATADLTAAETAVQAKLDSDAEFKFLLSEQDGARHTLETLRAAGESSTSPAYVGATQKLQDATNKVNVARIHAMQSDTAYASATENKRQAQQVVDQLRKRTKDQAELDPEWIKANDALQAAKADLDAQRKQLAEQQRQRAEAARQQRIQNSRQRQQQQQAPPRMGGGY